MTITLTTKQIVTLAVVGYFIMSALTYGATLARWNKGGCSYSCGEYVIGAVVAGVFWPISVPYTISYHIFRE